MIEETRIEFRDQGDEVWHIWSNSIVGGVAIEFDKDENVVSVTIPGDIDDYKVMRMTRS